MLREDGFIYDDGTTSRLSENRFYMTTTTAYAAGVMTHLEFCSQVLWPQLQVQMASVTDQWAQMAIAGPKSRKILQAIVDDDIADSAVPFLAAREVTLFGGRLKGRLFRISFSGELAFELAIPAGYGEAVADAIMEVGARTRHLLPMAPRRWVSCVLKRAMSPIPKSMAQLRLATLVSGGWSPRQSRTLSARQCWSVKDCNRPDRLQLVGVKPIDPKETFRTGAHILANAAPPSLENDQGYVTSSCFSPNLGHTIGLALVKRGPERLGETVTVWNGLKNEFTKAMLCSPVFVDPQNEKLHA